MSSHSLPLLSYLVSGFLHLITKNCISRHFKKLVALLNYNPALSFHALRFSGDSLAFSSGVPISPIQAHGTWSSEALRAYIDPTARGPCGPLLFLTNCLTPLTFLSLFLFICILGFILHVYIQNHVKNQCNACIKLKFTMLIK
jgi:hypothetical protein